jgi:hypothetical protein
MSAVNTYVSSFENIKHTMPLESAVNACLGILSSLLDI